MGHATLVSVAVLTTQQSLITSLDVSRHPPAPHLSIIPLFFPFPLRLPSLCPPFLGLAPLALALDSSPADPGSPALHFCTLISLSAFALRDKSLHTAAGPWCLYRLLFNDRQLNESTLLAWQQLWDTRPGVTEMWGCCVIYLALLLAGNWR